MVVIDTLSFLSLIALKKPEALSLFVNYKAESFKQSITVVIDTLSFLSLIALKKPEALSFSLASNINDTYFSWVNKCIIPFL